MVWGWHMVGWQLCPVQACVISVITTPPSGSSSSPLHVLPPRWQKNQKQILGRVLIFSGTKRCGISLWNFRHPPVEGRTWGEFCSPLSSLCPVASRISPPGCENWACMYCAEQTTSQEGRPGTPCHVERLLPRPPSTIFSQPSQRVSGKNYYFCLHLPCFFEDPLPTPSFSL